MMRYHASALSALVAAALPALAHAQAPLALTVGEIASTQDCKLYTGTAGQSSSSYHAQSAGYVGPMGAGGAGSVSANSSYSWTTFFYQDCVNHFEGIRNAFEAALASSGKVILRKGGLKVSGRINTVTSTANASVERRSADASRALQVSGDITVRDAAGRVVYGVPLVASTETGSLEISGGVGQAAVTRGDGLYGILQQQFALGIARKVVLHFQPMVVTAAEGRTITVSYGEPFLERGMIVRAFGRDGSDVRYRVSSVSDGAARATLYSDGDPSRIVPGSRAEIADPGESRWEKAELP